MLVIGVDLFLEGLVLVGELLGIADHGLDLLFGETALVVGDGDALGLAGSLLVSGDGEYGVLINLEGHFDLGDTTGSGGDASEVELAEEMVILGHGALTLEHLDGDGGLLVLVGGEGLRLLGGNNGTTGDDLGHDTSNGLNTEGKRGHIDKENVLGLL